MLYKRSSFLKWLAYTYECEIEPLKIIPKVLFVKHMNVSNKMFVNSKD